MNCPSHIRIFYENTRLCNFGFAKLFLIVIYCIYIHNIMYISEAQDPLPFRMASAAVGKNCFMIALQNIAQFQFM